MSFQRHRLTYLLTQDFGSLTKSKRGEVNYLCELRPCTREQRTLTPRLFYDISSGLNRFPFSKKLIVELSKLLVSAVSILHNVTRKHKNRKGID